MAALDIGVAFDELLSRGVARIITDYLRKVAVK
jgi:hypothetical protein